MYLTVTDSAKERIEHITRNHNGKLALYYNDNFKGTYACSIRGVFTLKLLSENAEGYNEKIDSNIGTFYMENTDYMELEKEMTLDYNKARNVLSLRSPFGTIADNMDVVDEENNKLY